MHLLQLDAACAWLVGAHDATSALTQTLAARGWKCTSYETASGLLQRMRKERCADVVILAPGDVIESHIEFCRQVKFDRRTAFVCIIFVLSTGNPSHRLEAYNAGANDCIDAGAIPEEILIRLMNALRAKRFSDTLEDAASVLASLACAIEGRDAYTMGHVDRVAVYSLEIGKRIGLGVRELETLRFGAVLHDIGKVSIPDAILNKPGKLDEFEAQIVRRHPIIGYDILKPSRLFHDVLPIVRWHHERPNGKGYPDGLAGDDLPVLPRIVATADVFDALSTARPYRGALSPWECDKILQDMAARGDLDATLVDVLLTVLGANREIGLARS